MKLGGENWTISMPEREVGGACYILHDRFVIDCWRKTIFKQTTLFHHDSNVMASREEERQNIAMTNHS